MTVQIIAGHPVDDEPEFVEPPGIGGPAGDERPPGAVLAAQYTPVDWHALWADTSTGPDWLVPDVIERGRLHALYAPKKAGKSLLCLVMVAGLVTGGPLLGRPNPHGRRLRVLYIDQENAPDDLRQRLSDAGYGPDDLAELIYLSFPALPPLDTTAGGLHLYALVEHYRPDLLVLDTTSRVVAGEENSADTFRALYRHSLVAVKAAGVGVLRIDHAGKDPTSGQRGSSAKGDDLDTAWMLLERGHGRFTLRRDFQRTNHHPAQIELVQHPGPLRYVRGEHGGDRPEVDALVEQLDALRVPVTASRRDAREALTAAGIKATDANLGDAVKIRKSGADDARTTARADDQLSAFPDGADDAHHDDESPAHGGSAPPAHHSHHGGESQGVGSGAGPPVSRSAPGPHTTPGPAPEPTRWRVSGAPVDEHDDHQDDDEGNPA